MSTSFPHVNLTALKKFAAATAEHEHPYGRSGRKSKKPVAIVNSCEDTIWAGEKMILITFDKKSLPLGPHSMLAHFPQGRPRFATQTIVGMTATVQASPIRINAPSIYAYRDIMPNDIGAEVVLMEKVPGECLETVWPTLTSFQEVKVCVKLVELLLKLFNYRGSLICSDLEGTDTSNRGASILPAEQRVQGLPIYGQTPILQSRPFTERPFWNIEPQPALTSTTDYLVALAERMDNVFGDPAANAAASNVGPPHNVKLSETDVHNIQETWRRLGTLIPYHTGGFYIPGTLSSEARRVAYSVLQSREFGILHNDMQMFRFIVQIIPKPDEPNPSDPDPEIILTLTGWEHSHRAPLWSCARLPLFLSPRLTTREPVTWERQAYLRNLMFFLMNDKRMLPTSWEWIVAYVYGVPERWFEGLMSSHWIFRDAVEEGLVKLKVYWEAWRPDIPFPLEVGEKYIGSKRYIPHKPKPEPEPAPWTEGLFMESVNALARASGTNIADWELAQKNPQCDLD